MCAQGKGRNDDLLVQRQDGEEQEDFKRLKPPLERITHHIPSTGHKGNDKQKLHHKFASKDKGGRTTYSSKYRIEKDRKAFSG